MVVQRECASRREAKTRANRQNQSGRVISNMASGLISK
jgi:hypothetical protein